MKKRTAILFIGLNALTFPLFLIFFYPKLPTSIPMQFTFSGKVRWSLPLNVALVAFCIAFFVYVGQVFFRFRKEEAYPTKDALVAFILPELFIVILSVAMIIK